MLLLSFGQTSQSSVEFVYIYIHTRTQTHIFVHAHVLTGLICLLQMPRKGDNAEMAVVELV
jgi:hypothetical protein